MISKINNMKNTLLLISQLFLINICFSQDVITKKNGDDINAKIIEVNQLDIKYKKQGASSGPTYSMDKSEILMIKYEDGSKDIFNDQLDKSKISNSKKVENMYDKGIEDAKSYYKRRNCGAA
jgi:hypothetical protein